MIYVVQYTSNCYGRPISSEFFRTEDINEAHHGAQDKGCIACQMNCPGYPGPFKCKVKFVVKEYPDLLT